MMKKNYLFLYYFLFAASFGWGQSNPGDIAIIAVNCDSGDDFAFVTLVDIPADAKIYFTDNEWDGSAFNDLNEGEITWTNGASVLPAGSIVVFTDPLNGGGSVNVGSHTGNGWNLSSSDDWFYALTEAPATSYTSTPTFLAAFANDAGNGWLTGTGLTEGTNAIDFNNDHDGFKYTGIRTGENAFSDYLPLIYNSSNWQDESSDGENILPVSTTAFEINSGSTSVQFSSSTATVGEADGMYTLTLEITNEDGSEATTCDVELSSGSGSADDINNYTTTTVTFSAGSSVNQTVNLTITDDAVFEGDEDLVFQITTVDGGNNATVGSNDEFTLTISDNDYPTVSTFPYSESFESTDHYWTFNPTGGGDGNWDRTNDGGSFSPGDDGSDGSYYMWFYGYNLDADDWLISPAFDMTSTSFEILSFQSWYRNSGPNVELRISTDYGSHFGSPNEATWTTLSPAFPLSEQTWSSSGNIDISAYSSAATYIAFYYTGTDVDRNWAIDEISIRDFAIDPEPTNHVLDFVAVSNSESEIGLTWSDNDGGQAADGFLILASTTNSFTPPVDQISQANDLDLSDGSGVYNATHGDESYVWSGLNTGLQYYFQIYPYTNFGNAIDYKTDGIIPSADASPEEALTNEKYELITSLGELTDGYYVIVNDGDQYAMSNSNNGSYFVRINVSPTNDIITNPDASIVWKIETHMDGGRTIYSENSAKYVSYTGSSNAAYQVDAVNGGNERWSFTYSSDAFVISNISVNSRDLQYNASSPRFACYTGSQHDLHLYKLTKPAGLWKTNAASEDWHTGTNWEDGNVPTSSVDVIIPTGCTNYPTISASANCNNLLIKSDENGDASLKGQGYLTIAGTVTVERYFTGYTLNGNGWHFISSPIHSMTIAGSDFVTGAYDLYRWGETTTADEKWLNYKDPNNTFSHTEFEDGLGYLSAINSGGIKEFTGNALNTGSFQKTLTYTNGEGDGWNLVGNPFPSGLYWNEVTKGDGVGAAFYIVDPNDGSYNSSNGDLGDVIGGVIPPHQGFFIQVNQETTITMLDEDQVHTNTQFYKSVNEFAESLSVELKGENSSNKTYFQFRDDATKDFDFQTDAYKLFGWATIAQVYSEIEEVQYSINCLPHSEETIRVPLCISVQSDEQLSLNFSGMETFFNTVKIELEDKQLGFTQNIANNPTYTFEASVQDNPNRFLLHFNGVTGVEDVAHQNNIQVYSVDDIIYINSLEDLSADILVYNINGQLFYNGQINGESLKRVSLGTSSGVYLVNIVSEETSSTHKVYVK